MTTEEHQHDLNLLAAHLEDRLDERERQGLIEHLAGCGECRAALASLARGADLLPRPASAAPASPRRWRLPGSVWLPLVATLVVAVATLTRLEWRTPPDAGSPGRVAASSPPPGDTAGPVRPSPAHESAPTPARSVPPSPRTGSPGGSAASDERVLVLRGTQRRVAGKTFRLVFGEWVDADFDAARLLPEVGVATAEERSALLARVPALAPYAALGERVRVVHDGTVYVFRVDPAP